MKEFNEIDANKELEKGYEQARDILKDKNKTERLLQRLENKLKLIPVAGKTLSMIPTMISLVRNYIKKEYTDIPVGTIVAIISALTYWLSPVDAIPDIIPGIGYVDDAAVIAACLKLIQSDINDYEKWRKENNLYLDIQ